MFILGLVTLFTAIHGLVNAMKTNIDAFEFFLKTLCGLLVIGFILYAEKFVAIVN